MPTTCWCIHHQSHVHSFRFRAGAFEVRNPAGSLIGTGTIETFDNQIKFVLAEAGKFTSDVTHTIAQPAGSGQLAIVDKDATNGTDVPFGILGERC